mmetsp:Transcript_36588/g.79982  ORF Transcript_36588/g.79982 Transcript_36588/m.79982 type:complete len:186 (+) Transcript_36588:171-728(+)
MTTSQHPLRGIVNTNDNPELCAACSAPMPRTLGVHVTPCCGKGLCTECTGNSMLMDPKSCHFCRMNRSCQKGADRGKFIGAMKRRAKKGQPWAQLLLARFFHWGDILTQSDFEAVRWCRKAASCGHPAAYLLLGDFLTAGNGCAQDLDEAMRCANKALKIDAGVKEDVLGLLLDIGGKYEEMGEQ